MYRQSSIRNQRNKGLKVKHALQSCLLLAICFWLIYQLKRSHDKKKEFQESDADISLHGGNSGGLIKLGRKDIHFRDQVSVIKNEQHDEAAEEEETTEEEEVEENKHEEDGPEEKNVDEEDGGLRDGDDETDEHEVEKLDAEVDREEDSVNDEERGDGNEIKNEEETIHGGSGRTEKESFVEDAGHDGDDKNNHETREELYKADDASIAVTHDRHTESSVDENEGLRISDEHHEKILEQENNQNNGEETNNDEIMKELEVEGGGIAKDDTPSNVTDSESNATTSLENTLDNSQKGSSPNNTSIEVSDDSLVTRNRTTEVTTQNPQLSLQNVTQSMLELDHHQGNVTEGTSTEGSNLQTIALEQGNYSTTDTENIDSNSTGNVESINSDSKFGSFSDPSNDTDSSSLVRITRSEDSLEVGNSTESATENNEATKSAKSDTSDGKDEVLESAMTEHPEEVQIDSVDLSDSSNSLDEKDVRTDLDTLPEIQTEGTNSEDVAAE